MLAGQQSRGHSGHPSPRAKTRGLGGEENIWREAPNHPSWEPAKLYHPSQYQQGQPPLGGPGVSSRDHTGTTKSPTHGLLEALSGAGGSLQALLNEGGGHLPGRKRRERSPSRRRGAGGERQMGRQAGVPTWREEAASSRHFFSLP